MALVLSNRCIEYKYDLPTIPTTPPTSRYPVPTNSLVCEPRFWLRLNYCTLNDHFKWVAQQAALIPPQFNVKQLLILTVFLSHKHGEMIQTCKTPCVLKVYVISFHFNDQELRSLGVPNTILLETEVVPDHLQFF